MERGFIMIFMMDSYLSAKILIIIKNLRSILPFPTSANGMIKFYVRTQLFDPSNSLIFITISVLVMGTPIIL